MYSWFIMLAKSGVVIIFCRTYELGMVFKFFNGWKHHQKKNILWHRIHETQISAAINKVLPEHSPTHSFM